MGINQIIIKRVTLCLVAFLCISDRFFLELGINGLKPIYFMAISSVILFFNLLKAKQLKINGKLLLSYVFFTTLVVSSNLWVAVIHIDKLLLILLLVFMAIILILGTLDDSDFNVINLAFVVAGIFISLMLCMSDTEVEGRVILESFSNAEYGVNDPNFQAMLLLVSFWSAEAYASNTTRLYKVFGSLSCVLIAYAIFLTGSRGALLALLLTFFYKLAYEKKYIQIIFLLITVFFISIFFIDYFVELLGKRFTIDFMLETGGAGRADIWMVAIEMIKQNFFLGVGIGNFPDLYTSYALQMDIGVSRGFNREVHNTALQVWSELGALGFISIICIIYYSYKNKFTMIMHSHPELIYSFCSLLISSLFLSALAEKVLWLELGLIGGYKAIYKN